MEFMEKAEFNFKSLQKVFESHADRQTANGQKVYLKNQFEFLGIKTPLRRQVQKPFLKKEWVNSNAKRKEVMEILWGAAEREYQYFGQELILLAVKNFDRSEIGLIENMIIRKSWWDTVDFLATKLAARYFLLYPEEIQSTVNRWLSGGNRWLIRSAILFQLHYKKKTDTQLLAYIILSQQGSKEFFINKAIGWALRQYSRTNPQWVHAFIASHELDPLSKREGGRLLG